MILVIPAYNEGDRLPVNDFTDWLQSQSTGVFVFVNDGSKDNTLDVLNALKAKFPERVFVVNLTKNVGKAMAVHSGFQWAFEHLDGNTNKSIGYLDADLATPLLEALRLHKILINSNLKLVFGSRILKIGSNIERKGYRHYLGRIVATFISLSLKLPIYDTQCGAKFFVFNSYTSSIFKEPFISRWLFDVEIFWRIKTTCNFHKDVREEPLQEWIEKGGSKITFKDTLKIPFELIKINANEKKRKR